jgi:hypothetical protein
MSRPFNKRLEDLEAMFVDNEHQSKAEALLELQSHAVDAEQFLGRVKRTVQDGYRRQLRLLAVQQQAAQSTAPSFLAGTAGMSRAVMLEVFEKIRSGGFGAEYREAALARCRNKDATELTDEELRSWLEDVGGMIGDPEE